MKPEQYPILKLGGLYVFFTFNEKDLEYNPRNLDCWWCGAPGAKLGAEPNLPDFPGCVPDCKRDTEGNLINRIVHQ